MGLLRRIREIITDHGTQFYANKRDKEGNAEHSFEQYLKFQGVKHILCRYNHPQSNGKVERWFQEYKKHRGDFPTLEDFICWYNNRPHGSHDLQTPEQVFWQRAQAHLLGVFSNGQKNKTKANFLPDTTDMGLCPEWNENVYWLESPAAFYV